MRNSIIGENIQSICRVCGTADETVTHFVLEWSKLAQKQYKQLRHDKAQGNN